MRRERAAYNKGLDRARWDRVLSHVKRSPAWERCIASFSRRTRSTQDIIASEIGSSSWTATRCRESFPRRLLFIDISESNLQKGIPRSERLDVQDRTDFVLMDAHSLGLPDNYVDVVFGASVLHHLEFDVAVREIHRPLNAGGFVWFS